MKMRIGLCFVVLGVLFCSGLWVAGQPQVKDAPVVEDSSRDADRKAILQSALDFTAAFEKGDAKAVAALWTELGEYESDDGAVLRGRPAIEAAFVAHFKKQSSGKMEIKVESIRFLSRDTAIEEGLTRTTASDSLPDSARYSVLHVREDGKWRIARSRESGAGENRMTDLDWMIGSWRSEAKSDNKDDELVISIARDKDQPFVVAKFEATAAGKAVSLGTMKIGIDPTSGQFMSWHFDPDGGHGHGLWMREGKHWAIDSRGVQADGAETAAVNILTRLGADEIGWRSIDRMVGGQAQPDSAPIKLKRVAAAH
jgi:uncharacterized protein (TIGR02246 family)